MLLIWIGVLVLSLIVLIKGADWFTEGAESVGLRFGIPPFVVGVTIVSIGTSLPELASSIVAVLQGNSEIVIANVIGSNIANILFVLGLGALLAGVRTKRDVVRIDIPILLGTTLLLWGLSYNGVFGRWGAMLFLFLILLYLYKEFSRNNVKAESHYSGNKAFFVLGLGLLLVVVGAKYLVDSVLQISLISGISTAVISASVVAFGTSVPEAFVTVIAVLKKQREIALGNIVGSNVFNILLITGVSGLIAPLTVPPIITTIGIPFLLGATLLLGLFMMNKKLDRREGLLFLLLYAGFIVLLFWQTL